MGAQGVERVLAGGGAKDVEGDDVAGAFPNGAEMGVAQQAGVGPLLDVAAAAADLHGVAGDLAGVTAGAEFEERGEDTEEGVGAGLAGIGAAQGVGGLKEHGAGLFGRQRELGQLALHEGHVDQQAAEGAAVLRDVGGFGQGTAHEAGGADRRWRGGSC